MASLRSADQYRYGVEAISVELTDVRQSPHRSCLSHLRHDRRCLA
jgi:hypothetical protein